MTVVPGKISEEPKNWLHRITCVALRWDVMFKMTKIELKLIPDTNMYIFFEKSYNRWNLLYF